MLSLFLFLGCALQDHPDLNKEWVGKRFFPAHGGTINILLPNSKEVEWPFATGKALGKKGEYIELHHKKLVGLVRMLEVVHEDRAFEYYRMKIEDEPNRYFWKYMLAMTMVVLDDDNALQQLDSLVANRPSCELLYLRARYHMQRFRYHEAMVDLDAALFLGPAFKKRLQQIVVDAETLGDKSSYAHAYHARAELLTRLGQYDKAKSDLKDSEEIMPGEPYAVFTLSDIAFDQKDYESALSNINKAIKIDDEVPGFYLKRLIILLAQNKLQQAQEDLPSCLNRNDLDSNDLLNAAWLLATHPNEGIRNGRISLELAQRAIGMKQTKDKLYLATLAAAYAETGDFANAIKYQQEAMTSPVFQKDYKEIAEHQLALYRQNKPYRWRCMVYQGNSMPGWK